MNESLAFDCFPGVTLESHVKKKMQAQNSKKAKFSKSIFAIHSSFV
jgi:hypothetical protein